MVGLAGVPELLFEGPAGEKRDILARLRDGRRNVLARLKVGAGRYGGRAREENPSSKNGSAQVQQQKNEPLWQLVKFPLTA